MGSEGVFVFGWIALWCLGGVICAIASRRDAAEIKKLSNREIRRDANGKPLPPRNIEISAWRIAESTTP